MTTPMIANHSPQLLRPSSQLSWRTYTAATVHEGLSVWRQLERRLGESSLACSATWTDRWLRVYGSVVPYRILAAEAGGLVRGICLLATGAGQKLGPVGIRTKHLGTAGEPQPGSVCVEYNRLLVEPEYEAEFVGGIAESLRRDLSWEQLRIDGFSEQDLRPWLPHFPQAEIQSRDSRYFDLNAARQSGSEILSLLGKSTRSNLRRRLKQYGELDCQWAESADDAEEIFRELVSLHQARWHAVGQPGAFASDRFLRFQTDAGMSLFLERRAVFFRVRHAGDTVGCLLLLVDRNRLLDYLSGFAPFDVKPSPGLISHYLCMEEALRRGYDAYDFLVGDKRHKDNLSTHTARLCWLTWSRPTLKLRALHGLRSLKQRLDRYRRRETPTIKANPEA